MCKYPVLSVNLYQSYYKSINNWLTNNQRGCNWQVTEVSAIDINTADIGILDMSRTNKWLL